MQHAASSSGTGFIRVRSARDGCLRPGTVEVVAHRRLIGEERANRGGDLLDVILQGEVSRVDETNVGVGDVALEGFGPGRQERRVQRDVAGVVEE
jgi:hypothetical protein